MPLVGPALAPNDLALAAEVAAVVAVPRAAPADSFVLHAPLELLARVGLLRLVRPDARPAARARLVELGARYEAAGAPATFAPARIPKPSGAVAALVTALDAGDLDAADGAALALAGRHPADAVADGLADALLARTGAAAHAPILLHLLARVDPRGDLGLALARPLLRELARQPDARIEWIAVVDGPVTGDGDPEAARRALVALPHVGLPGTDFIAPLLAHAERHGVAELLRPHVGLSVEHARTVVLRTAASSMLREPDDAVPYGWTHALTLPQAVLAVAPRCRHPRRAVAVALTHLAAFRLAMGTVAPEPPATTGHPRDEVALATAAALHDEAHVVKYLLACLHAATDDPAARPLFLAAADRLLRYWGA